MKLSIKRLLFSFEEIAATVGGFLFRSFPAISVPLYLAFSHTLRRSSDRIYFLSEPFLSTLGDKLFAQKSEIWVATKLLTGVEARLDLTEKTQRQIISMKIFEMGTSRFLISVLKTGDTMVDVGANVGYFSLLASPLLGGQGRILALEPEQQNFKILQCSIEGNHITNITAINCAAGPIDGSELILNVNPLNRGGNSILPFFEYKGSGIHLKNDEAALRFGSEALTQRVRVRSLDALFAEHQISNARFMKIDVEGFEYKVLQGAQDILRRQIVEYINCEVGNSETRELVIDQFINAGYAPHVLNEKGERRAYNTNSDFGVRDILFVAPKE